MGIIGVLIGTVMGSLGLGCTAAQAGAPGAANVGVDMQFENMRLAQSAASDSVEIRAGTTGQVGGWQIGVVSVPKASQTSPPANRASLAVAAYPAGVPAEFTLQVGPQELVPLGEGMHRLLRTYPGDARDKGRVVIARTPAEPRPPSGQAVLVLAHGERLRLNGPELVGASDMEATTWGADHVDVEWRPSQYAREDTDPADIKRTQLKVGSRLQIGAVSLKVLAIEPQTADHPQWITLEASAAGGRR